MTPKAPRLRVYVTTKHDVGIPKWIVTPTWSIGFLRDGGVTQPMDQMWMFWTDAFMSKSGYVRIWP